VPLGNILYPKQSLKESLSKQILLIMDLSVDDRGGAGRE
jgi:hypothetical protein